jgi:UDP-N-acetylglucosamine 2-epimerase (non-hydrolysing)
MKVAPLYHALLKEPWCDVRLVHTGQHFDSEMSDAFFADLALPAPHVHLGAGGGTHAQQTARVMTGYEEVCLAGRPDLAVVMGDVDSTMACALAAKKLGILVAHLESGLRSRDRSMPEEINRVVTDAVSDWLWTPSPDADANLLAEGIPPSRIVRVGNIMIDSYVMVRPKVREQDAILTELGLEPGGYGVVTLHRPSNVDDRAQLATLVGCLEEAAELVPLVFPVHPRTYKNLVAFGLLDRVSTISRLRLTKPISYTKFMRLVEDCKLVITDSGGIQEETTYLGVPCLTLRENTERPITVTQGSNTLVNAGNVVGHVRQIATGRYVEHRKCPDLWDGHTAQRIVTHLAGVFGETERTPVEYRDHLGNAAR